MSSGSRTFFLSFASAQTEKMSSPKAAAYLRYLIRSFPPWRPVYSSKPVECSVGLQLLQRQAHLEAGRSWLGLDLYKPAVLPDDPHDHVEAQTQSAAWGFGGEEGLEDAVLDLGGDPGAVVPDLNQQQVA